MKPRPPTATGAAPAGGYVACHDERVSTPAQGLARLRDAAASGELEALCRRHAVRVLTVFGSAARAGSQPRDLDVGILSQPGLPFDAPAVVADLIDLTGVDRVDLAHLNQAGPLLRERALVGCVPLYESSEGDYAGAQTAAIGERIETDAARRLDLELLRR
jgi:predicted nucleotidyltransferase